jgi:hypothetical protein
MTDTAAKFASDTEIAAIAEPVECLLCGEPFSSVCRQDKLDPGNCTSCLRERQRSPAGGC